MDISSCIDTSFPLCNYIYVNLTGSKNSFDTRVKLHDGKSIVQTTALIDSGAYSCFIGKRCFANSGFLAIPLPGGRRIRAFNADGTENCTGAITHFCRVQLCIREHETTQSFLITDLGAKDIIIGYSFLRQHNPVFDFKLETMEFSRCCRGSTRDTQPNTTLRRTSEHVRGGGVDGDEVVR
jgi:hypothetical protein